MSLGEKSYVNERAVVSMKSLLLLALDIPE